MKTEEKMMMALKPTQVNRNRGFVPGEELKDVKTEGKPWPWPGDKFFVVKEYPRFVQVEVRTPHDTKYNTTFSKVDMYTGQVSFRRKGGAKNVAV